MLTPDREQERPPRRPKKHESFRAERSGIDPETVKADAQAARRHADNGQSFRAALEQSGAYVLARGDRRDFVIIDGAGDDHSLGRRLGIKAAELRAFMADLDPASLPSVAEAKAMQEARCDRRHHQQQQPAPENFDRDAYNAAWAEAVNAGAIKAAEATTPHLEHRSDIETDELERRKHRQPESEDMDEDIAAKQREQRQQIEDREAATYNGMVADKNRADRYLQEWQIQHDHGERNRKSLQEQLFRRDIEDGITDVRVRAMLAAGESRDFVQMVRAEGAMITREHRDLQRDIALEQDPDKKQMLEFRRDIQHADYMALTNERVAAMSNLNSEQYTEAHAPTGRMGAHRHRATQRTA